MGLMQSGKAMPLDNGFVVCVGPFNSMVYGGPFRRYVPGQRRLVGVKMAEEITAEHDISIPTRDFDVPAVPLMQEGLKQAVKQITMGNDLYVGCMGGIGRTGLFMGCLIKSLQDAGERCVPPGDDPVMLVRNLYSSHAIETDEQMAFVRGFDTAPVVAEIKALLKVFNEVEIVERVVVERVPVYVPMTPWNTIKALFGFKA